MSYDMISFIRYYKHGFSIPLIRYLGTIFYSEVNVHFAIMSTYLPTQHLIFFIITLLITTTKKIK